LVETGFDVTAFERNTHVGGLWRFNPDKNQTTVLRCPFNALRLVFNTFTKCVST
jgi:hypothetical protein